MANIISNKAKILEGLNDQQKAVVTSCYGPMMVSAGPGSGKTFSMVRRAAYMLEEGIPAKNMLMFTFTKKAANEIKERLVKQCGDDALPVTVSTYHSFCAKLLRRYAELAGRTDKYTIYDEDDKNTILAQLIKIYSDSDRKTPIKEVSNKISHYKEQLLTPTDVINTCPPEREMDIAFIYDAYTKELKKQNAFDFDDLIFNMVKIFDKYPYVVKEVNQKYKYITADEVQDSAPSDLALIQHLGGKSMNVCFVGDVDQSKLYCSACE